MRTHGLTKTETYKVWQAMHQRCRNPRCRSYADYGARGIDVCPEWESFEGFLSDMGMRPPGATLDRIDNNLGYSKQNCRWASVDLQNQNKRSTRLNAELVGQIRRRVNGGERARSIARELGVSEGTVSMVVNRHTWKNVA